MFCIEITMSLVWGSKFNVVFCRYCSSGRGRNSGQSEDHQETTEGQCVRVPGGRGGNVWREREKIKSCRSCGNTPWLIFIHRNTKYNLCIYSCVYAKYNKTVIHVTIQNYSVWKLIFIKIWIMHTNIKKLEEMHVAVSVRTPFYYTEYIIDYLYNSIIKYQYM